MNVDGGANGLEYQDGREKKIMYTKITYHTLAYKQLGFSLLYLHKLKNNTVDNYCHFHFVFKLEKWLILQYLLICIR